MLIYKITNLINNKIYIGQTRLDFQTKVNSYKYVGVSPKRPIEYAIHKYGVKNFRFEIIIDNITSQQKLDYYERFYITKFNSYNKSIGYNVELGGNGNGKHSSITKRKISNAQKDELNHMFGKPAVNRKKVIDLVTNIIYNSATDAANSLGCSVSHVCSVARGERGSTNGHVFCYLDNNGKITNKININRIKNKQLREAIKHKTIPC